MFSHLFTHQQPFHLSPEPNDPFFASMPAATHTTSSGTGSAQKLERGSPTPPKRGGDSASSKGLEERKYPDSQPQSTQQPVHEQEHRIERHAPRDQQLVEHSPFDLFADMDSMFEQQLGRMSRMFGGGFPDPSEMASNPNGAYNYHSSSSSYSSDGSGGKPFYRHSAHSSRGVGGVSESRSRYEDSLGNRREQQQWALGKQQREVLTDRNAKGEERSRENLRELEPEQVDKFTREWEERRKQVDPHQKMLGGPMPAMKGQQAAIKSDTQQQPIRQIKSHEQQSGGQKSVKA